AESAEATPTLTPEQHARYSESLDKANRDWQTTYSEQLDKANREHSQALIDHAEKESRNRAKWAEKAYGAKKSEADKIAASNRKQLLDRASDEYTRLAQDNIRDTHNMVRGRLDARWEDFRQQMASSGVDSTEVYGVANEAQDNLRGATDSLKQFNDVIRE